jgi:hypothetical protein
VWLVGHSPLSLPLHPPPPQHGASSSSSMWNRLNGALDYWSPGMERYSAVAGGWTANPSFLVRGTRIHAVLIASSQAATPLLTRRHPPSNHPPRPFQSPAITPSNPTSHFHCALQPPAGLDRQSEGHPSAFGERDADALCEVHPGQVRTGGRFQRGAGSSGCEGGSSVAGMRGITCWSIWSAQGEGVRSVSRDLRPTDSIRLARTPRTAH